MSVSFECKPGDHSSTKSFAVNPDGRDKAFTLSIFEKQILDSLCESDYVLWVQQSSARPSSATSPSQVDFTCDSCQLTCKSIQISLLRNVSKNQEFISQRISHFNGIRRFMNKSHYKRSTEHSINANNIKIEDGMEDVKVDEFPKSLETKTPINQISENQIPQSLDLRNKWIERDEKKNGVKRISKVLTVEALLAENKFAWDASYLSEQCVLCENSFGYKQLVNLEVEDFVNEVFPEKRKKFAKVSVLSKWKVFLGSHKHFIAEFIKMFWVDFVYRLDVTDNSSLLKKLLWKLRCMPSFNTMLTERNKEVLLFMKLFVKFLFGKYQIQNHISNLLLEIMDSKLFRNLHKKYKKYMQKKSAKISEKGKVKQDWERHVRFSRIKDTLNAAKTGKSSSIVRSRETKSLTAEKKEQVFRFFVNSFLVKPEKATKKNLLDETIDFLQGRIMQLALSFIERQITQLETPCHLLVHPICAYFSTEFRLKSFMNMSFEFCPSSPEFFRKFWVPFVSSEWIIKTADFKIFIKNLKFGIKELKDVPHRSPPNESGGNPLISKYPNLGIGDLGENKGKCLKRQVINIFTSDPISLINSTIKFEGDLLARMNSQKSRTQEKQEKCYLCKKQIKRRVEAVVVCEITNCKHVSHLYCSLFDKYLETRTVGIMDDYYNGVPIVRISKCGFEKEHLASSKSFEKRKLKKKGNKKINFDEEKMMNLISGLICVKFHSSIDGKEKLQSALKELFELNEEGSKCDVESQSEDRLDFAEFATFPDQFPFVGMLQQNDLNRLFEDVLSQTPFFNFSKFQKDLDLPTINKYFSNYLSNFFSENMKNQVIKSNSSPKASKAERQQAPSVNPNQSRSEKMVFNKPQLHRGKTENFKDKLFTSKDVDYSFIFESCKDFKTDLCNFLGKKDSSDKKQPLKFSRFLFPFQKDIFHRIKSLSLFRDFMSSKDLENQIKESAPVFKGLCTAHYKK